MIEKKAEVKIDKEMERRIFNAMWNTWDAIAPDTFTTFETNKMKRAEVIELVLDADRVSMFGNDEEAAKVLYSMPYKQMCRLARKEFNCATYTY